MHTAEGFSHSVTTTSLREGPQQHHLDQCSPFLWWHIFQVFQFFSCSARSSFPLDLCCNHIHLAFSLWHGYFCPLTANLPRLSLCGSFLFAFTVFVHLMKTFTMMWERDVNCDIDHPEKKPMMENVTLGWVLFSLPLLTYISFTESHHSFRSMATYLQWDAQRHWAELEYCVHEVPLGCSDPQ